MTTRRSRNRARTPAGWCLGILLALSASIAFAFSLSVTTLPDLSGWTEVTGVNNHGQTAVWKANGHVSYTTQPYMQMGKTWSFPAHDDTTCSTIPCYVDPWGAAMLRVHAVSGAGELFGPDDDVIQLFAASRVVTNGERHSGIEPIAVTLGHDDAVWHQKWQPLSINMPASTLVQYKVGAWQGPGGKDDWFSTTTTPGL